MQSEYDIFAFDSPNGQSPVVTGQVSKYLGMPAGIEIDDRWSASEWDPAKATDQAALVDNPAAPGVVNPGTDWQPTSTGGTNLAAIIDTGFPPYLRWTTGAADTNGLQMQANKGAVGLTKALFDTSAMDDLFFSITFRLVDANNNAATVEQSKFFFGLAAIDTSILAGVDDYIGFVKDDASGVIKLVADQTSGVPTTGASSSVNVFTLTAAHANKWITLSFRATKLDRTNQKGVVYAHIDFNRIPTGASKRMTTYAATLNLGTNSDVPGANMTPSIAYATGEAVAKQLHMASIIAAGAYKLG